ncbi:MAG: CDP-glucose 4,6-dehydratase [Actinobacteria bacterium]|nr:CDP-glucose 4,6-dehydratase [Actinomycetota bacterium]
MRYLITGHTGFKGAWLAAILKSQGHQVVGIALPALENSLYKRAELADLFDEEFFLDIRDRNSFKGAMKSARADVAFHLAAQPLVRESYKTPIETYETNVLGTLNFLDGIKSSGINASVVITTDKVYKNKNLLRGYTELDELGGHDPYSSSKAAADIATQSWVASYECKNISIARAGNVIGGGDWAADRLIPDLVTAFASGSTAKIRYPNAIRPWQHVADCLSGYLALSDLMLNKGVSGEWNFGPAIDTDTMVSKVAEIAANAWGGDASWEPAADLQLHEAGYLLLDSSKARQELNWQDKLGFEDSIKWSVDFYKSVFKGESPRDLLLEQVDRFLAL